MPQAIALWMSTLPSIMHAAKSVLVACDVQQATQRGRQRSVHHKASLVRNLRDLAQTATNCSEVKEPNHCHGTWFSLADNSTRGALLYRPTTHRPARGKDCKPPENQYKVSWLVARKALPIAARRLSPTGRSQRQLMASATDKVVASRWVPRKNDVQATLLDI